MKEKLSTVIYETDGAVARIILNLPKKANVQTSQMVHDVDDCLSRAERDESIKVLILKANGKGFCAGHSIRGGPTVYPEFQGDFERVWRGQYELFVWPVLRLWEFPKPTIAQVHGYAIGGGTVFACLTDLTIASEDAYFQMPLAQGWGMPGSETMFEPWLLMNWKKTMEYLLLAPTLTAREALDLGMVNRVVPPEDLQRVTEETAQRLARLPLTTLMTTKAGVKRAWEMMGMRVHLQYSSDLGQICNGAADVLALREESAQRGLLPRQMAER